MAENKKEEKLNIEGLSFTLKEGFLFMDHRPSTITKSGVQLGKIVSEQGDKPVNKGMVDCFQLMVPHMLMIIECLVSNHSNLITLKMKKQLMIKA
jgi:hypothetical protein